MKINPNDPAYPVVLAPHEGRDGTQQNYESGIPIRLEIAARMMAGLILEENKDGEGLGAIGAAEWALEYADALINAYNESEKE